MPPGDTLPAGYCHNCGYDLRGTQGLRCPECNTDRRQSSTALLERAAVWSVMDLPRWGSRVRAMVRIMAWPPAALRPGEPLTRWRHPELRVLAWVIAAYLAVELVTFASVWSLGAPIGAWEVVNYVYALIFHLLIWLVLSAAIAAVFCRVARLRDWTQWCRFVALVMVACPLSQLARRLTWFVSAAAPIELHMKYNLWHGIGVVGLAVFGWHACALLSATLGQRGRLNRLRLTILVILGLEWVFEIELWLLFYRITLWIRSFTGPEVY